MTAAAVELAAELVEQVVERTIEICAVPGPPLREADRCDVVERWWQQDGLDHITRDRTGNLWARIRPGEPGTTHGAIVVCAHLDTVFDPAEPHGARRVGNRLQGPGVGDDSVALAALSTLAIGLPASLTVPVWVLATIGEEGLGDLAGVRAALADPVVPIGTMIAVEGNYLGRVCTTGVGSARWRVIVDGPGGHAWEAAHAPNAVHVAAGMVHRVTTLERPAGARTAINVGTFSGGEAINARARRAVFELDVRSDRADALDALAAACERVLHGDAQGCTVTVRGIGRRPAGSIDPQHALVRSALAAQRAVGIEPRLTAASTDANAAHAAGLAAITVGVTYGEGEHTPEEWIDLDHLPEGLWTLTSTVERYAASLGAPHELTGGTTR